MGPAGGRRWGARHGSTVTASPGGQEGQVGAATHEVDVTGLDNGTPYTFTVTATYAVGTSPGASTTPISPIAGLTGPTNVTATAGDGSVTVT